MVLPAAQAEAVGVMFFSGACSMASRNVTAGFPLGRNTLAGWVRLAVTLLALNVADRCVVAGLISVSNASFETPSALFPSPNIASWQKTPKPDWYDESGPFMWTQLTGLFRNQPPDQPDHIDNCDGLQAMWLFVVPEVGLFQDYDSMDWNDPVPSRAFNATFTPGNAYQLKVGIVGTGGNMLQGVTLALSLYHRDEASNRVAVATTVVTNTTAVFSNNTHLVDCEVNVPAVQPGDAWAGKHIGIEFMSTVSSNMQGGYWDLDNVRLLEISPPTLRPITRNASGFQLSLQSEPGLRFEMLATTNLLLPPASWTSLGLITNVSGEADFTDPETNFAARYYQARWLP
jgi:hypothetical protein